MTTEHAAPQAPQRLVVRNTLYVVMAQVVVTPLTVLVNAVVARKLGATQFGLLYLATTFASLAFLFVEWGHAGALTGAVARDRSRAGELLGSSLAWRYGAALIAATVLITGCALLGYDRPFLIVVALALLVSLIGTFSFACHDVFRGFERTDFGALTYVGWQALTAAVTIPVMLFGGGLQSLLWAQATCAAVGALFMVFFLKPMGIFKLRVSYAAVKELLHAGTPFLIFGLIIALQANLDALLLSKLGSPESVGWHAAARKLVGLLIYPANALIAALYPTLCRLYLQDQTLFRSTAASALRLTSLVVMPVALGCALFPDIGIRIFSVDAYGQAEGNLRILAAYVLLVYFSMPLGCALTASGRQRPWVITQVVCLAISVPLNWLLIPWFQNHYGNGGLGLCVATLSSEVLMVSMGVWLLPQGILDSALLRKLIAAVLGGMAMAAVAWALHGVNSFVVAPLAVAAYVLGLWLAGGINANVLREGRALWRGPTAG